MATDFVRLEQWEQHCLNRLLLGHTAFCSPELSDDSSGLQRAVEAGLAVCRTREQVQIVFMAARYLAPVLERRGGWEESKHPRDKDGRWASGNGQTSSSTNHPAFAPRKNSGEDKSSPTRSSLPGGKACQRIIDVHTASNREIAALESQRFNMGLSIQRFQSDYDRFEQLATTAQKEWLKKQAEEQMVYAKAKLDKAGATFKSLNKEIKSLQRATKKVMQDTIYSSQSLPIHPRMVTSFTKKDQNALRQGFEAAARLMGDLPHQPVTIRIKESREGASYILLNSKTIHLNPGSKPQSIVHELGHWLENHNPDIFQKALSFFEARTTGETEVKLSVATNNEDYEDDEVTKVDHFLSPYMGRVYREDGKIVGTEIVSMGLQYFFEDPGLLAARDPEYFELIYNILHPNS